MFDESTLEHLVEIGRGGAARSMENLDIACFPCNWAHSKPLRDWLSMIQSRIVGWQRRVRYAELRLQLL